MRDRIGPNGSELVGTKSKAHCADTHSLFRLFQFVVGEVNMVTKEQMNGAQGFDEAHWPNFSDPNFSGDLHRRYGVEDRWNRGVNHDGKVDVNVDRQGVKIKVDGDRK